MDNTEQTRHRCEIRQLLRWRKERGSAWAAGYLEKHPRRAAIEPDIRAQWQRGGRGAWGEWIEG